MQSDVTTRLQQRDSMIEGDRMRIDVTSLTPVQRDTLIANHRRKGAQDAPLYLEALSERQRRLRKGLSFEKSFTIIKQAAREGRFLSYKELADASGVDWGQAHYAINKHLWDLVEYAARKGWPMLSAIVVNKPNVDSGKMEPETLKGFVEAARELGHVVQNEEAFLREQQETVFSWAQDKPAASTENRDEPGSRGPHNATE